LIFDACRQGLAAQMDEVCDRLPVPVVRAALAKRVC
jgi:hypothetical protein